LINKKDKKEEKEADHKGKQHFRKNIFKNSRRNMSFAFQCIGSKHRLISG